MANKQYSPGKHPNSLANLKLGHSNAGRHKAFEDENKKQRSLSVTDTGWNGIKLAAKKYGCKSVSEFIEKWGRGQLDLESGELDLSA